MQQVKIIEGCSNEEITINKWLKENPNIKIDCINIIPVIDRYIPNGEICNQWFVTTLIYREDK